jgi:hypothetical protein
MILVIAAGCVPARFRASPQLKEKVTSIKTVAIMPPGVKVYQIAVGGGTQLMDDATAAARQIVATAIENELGRRAGVVFTPFAPASATLDASNGPAATSLTEELEDTQALFAAVSASVWIHTYRHGEGAASDWRFVEKLTNFDYSLGPEVQRLAKLANVDALLFISGIDHISTGGRKGLIFLEALIYSPALLYPIAGPIAYVGYMASRAGRASLSVALADGTTGALLWYNIAHLGRLTDPHSAATLVEEVFENFPVGATPPKQNQNELSCVPNCPPAGRGHPPR